MLKNLQPPTYIKVYTTASISVLQRTSLLRMQVRWMELLRNLEMIKLGGCARIGFFSRARQNLPKKRSL